MQELAKVFMEKVGFEKRNCSLSVYFHQKEEMRTSVRGDDVVQSACLTTAKWFNGGETHVVSVMTLG